ncbi:MULTISPECIES: hypothetical protein [Aerosakkonema]|uniref:hypothetical protein n=1 Tax=Aerosakkonema TaxID=1246629 RepID=UPI0035B87D78
MKNSDPFENPDLKRVELFIYLTPIIGFFPALWTLYRRQGTRYRQAVSRLSVTLALSWLLGYILLGAGADASESMKLPLLLMNSLLTSSYFVVSVWLMIRFSQRQSLRIPIVSQIADRVVGKYLS